MTDNASLARTRRLSLPTILTFSIVTMSGQRARHRPRHLSDPATSPSHLGVQLAVVAAAFTLVRLIDIPVDPILGVFMDRTRTPIGRYRVWLLIGAPILMLAVYQLFMAKAGIGEAYLVAWLLVLYLGTSISACLRAPGRRRWPPTITNARACSGSYRWSAS